MVYNVGWVLRDSNEVKLHIPSKPPKYGARLEQRTNAGRSSAFVGQMEQVQYIYEN